MTGGGRQRAAGARGARLWWIVLLRAGVALSLGLGVLLSGRTGSALANFIAFYWLVGSLLTLRWVLANRGRVGNRLVASAGLVGVAAGALVLLRFVLRDLLSADAVLFVLGVTAVATGLLRLTGTFRDDQLTDERPRLPHRVALGTLEIGLGAVLILADEATRAVAIAAGLWGLVGGTILLRSALEMRQAARP
jgi:uncharacterized membrane protein HdeD (DUF308 family)